MNGITELASLFKERENDSAYAPVFGVITELPNLKIRLSDRITLDGNHIKKMCVPIYNRDDDGNYIYLHKEAVLLPYDDNQKYIVMGVVL